MSNMFAWINHAGDVTKVDIHNVMTNVSGGVATAAHEFQAAFNWVIGQAPTIAADIAALQPYISAGASAAGVFGGPSGELASGIIHTALTTASAASAVLNTAAAELHKSTATGAPTVVADAKALVAGYTAAKNAAVALGYLKDTIAGSTAK